MGMGLVLFTGFNGLIGIGLEDEGTEGAIGDCLGGEMGIKVILLGRLGLGLMVMGVVGLVEFIPIIPLLR